MSCLTCCKWTRLSLIVLLTAALALWAFAADDKKDHESHHQEWEVHDMNRPVPPVVTPGPVAEPPLSPPSDAIVLFDGKDLSRWKSADGKDPTWKVMDGFMEAAKGGIVTKDAFGDCQLHVEWASPSVVKGDGQARGNSGVFLMGHYEIQVVDTYNNRTYADGMAASVYGQSPPLVNACRKPGEWQTYDIVFRRPRFNADGSVAQPGTVTVLHNGILVQDHTTIQGATAHKTRAKYTKHGDRAPISLQDHGNPVRFRNIWLRDLEKPSAH